MLASGTACEADSSNPETQIAGNPDCTANLAERGLCEDMAMHGLDVERRDRRAEMLLSCWVERIEGILRSRRRRPLAVSEKGECGISLRRGRLAEDVSPHRAYWI